MQLIKRYRLILFSVGFVLLGAIAVPQIIVDEADQNFRKVAGTLQRFHFPFTGIVYSTYSDASLRRFATYWMGNKFGEELYWHPNGNRWIERHYSNGVPDGFQYSWYPNSAPNYRKEYDHGTPVGELWSWFETGNIASYVRYENGKSVTYKTWTFDGKPYYNYVWQDGQRVGIVGGDFCKKRKKRSLPFST